MSRTTIEEPVSRTTIEELLARSREGLRRLGPEQARRAMEQQGGRSGRHSL